MEFINIATCMVSGCGFEGMLKVRERLKRSKRRGAGHHRVLVEALQPVVGQACRRSWAVMGWLCGVEVTTFPGSSLLGAIIDGEGVEKCPVA